jgi:hypothetical protein
MKYLSYGMNFLYSAKGPALRQKQRWLLSDKVHMSRFMKG